MLKLQPRAGRIRQPSLHQVKFIYGQECLVSDISFTGIGISRTSMKFTPGLGSILTGELCFGAVEFNLAVRIVNHYDKAIGCSIIEKPESFRKFLKTKYHVELSAYSLKKIDKSRLRLQYDGEPFWYFDGYDSELFFIVKNNELVRYRISFLDNYIEAMTGTTPRYINNRTNFQKQSGYSGLQPVKDRDHIRVSEVERLLRFVNHVENLAPRYRDIIMASIMKMPREDDIKSPILGLFQMAK